jgi:DNA-binding transcriptional regulator YiaG
MPNIAAVFKDEIRRLARREIKAYTGGTKRVVAQSRREIARLKRLVQEQQKRLAYFASQRQQATGEPEVEDDPLAGTRFSSRSVRAQRRRLGLSAEDYGTLVGVSGLTIYNWEHGKARPRKSQLAALVAVRGIGKREALKRLADLKKPRGRRKKARR